MDVYCPRCGEPTDNDELHEQAQANGDTYAAVASNFRLVGCSAIDVVCSKPSNQTDRSFGLRPQDAATALYDLLGDDMDGAAAMMEDMGY